MPPMPADLAAHIRRGDAEPFEFGQMDCSTWAADWVLSQTGVDLAEDWRGQYSTREEYLRLLISRGSLVRVAARALQSIKAKQIAPAAAEPGDIGIIVTECREPALAIRGPDDWAAKTGDRLSHTPHASFAWRL